MAKAKKKAKPAVKKHKDKPTSARLLKNRPHDPEPPEIEEQETPESAGEEQPEGEELETPDTPKPKRGRPRQARLPGTEDPAIESLEALAESYAEARDERMRIGEREVELKTELLDEMRKNDKTKYFHAGVLIEVINSKDKVRVRIKKDE
jgi:hypothetical protein